VEQTSYRRTIALDLLREFLEEARRQAEREQAHGERLRTLIRAGKMAGLGPAQLAEASGLSRPGIYEVLRRETQGPVSGLEEIVLAAIGAGGATTRASLRGALRVSESRIDQAIEHLAQIGAISFGAAGYWPGTEQEIILLSPNGEEILDHHLRRALSSRREGWTAYMAVAEDEAGRLADAATKLFGRNRTALLPSNVRSDMMSPELGILFDVADPVGLFNEAARAWHDLRTEAGLDPRPVHITAFSPPRIRSGVLEAFARAAANEVPQRNRAIMRAVADAAQSADERTLCIRALTEAAWALRRAVDQPSRPRELSNGEAAFQELQAVAGLRLDGPRERIKEPLARALERATDRLGPIPAGRRGSFRKPNEDPHVVEGVAPSHADLVEIARAAGEALGSAHNATEGEVDVVEAVKAIAGTATSD